MSAKPEGEGREGQVVRSQASAGEGAQRPPTSLGPKAATMGPDLASVDVLCSPFSHQLLFQVWRTCGS